MTKATRGTKFTQRPHKKVMLGDIVVPHVPRQFKGKAAKGGRLSANPEYLAWIKTRDDFVVKALASGFSLQDAADALARTGTVIAAGGLRTSLDKTGRLPSSMKRGPNNGPKLAKQTHDDFKAVMVQLDGLVEKRLAPIREELARLQGVEKKYKALVSLQRQVYEATTTTTKQG